MSDINREQKVLIKNGTLQDIANAIREKKNENDSVKYKPTDMSTAIQNLAQVRIDGEQYKENLNLNTVPNNFLGMSPIGVEELSSVPAKEQITVIDDDSFFSTSTATGVPELSYYKFGKLVATQSFPCGAVSSYWLQKDEKQNIYCLCQAQTSGTQQLYKINLSDTTFNFETILKDYSGLTLKSCITNQALYYVKYETQTNTSKYRITIYKLNLTTNENSEFYPAPWTGNGSSYDSSKIFTDQNYIYLFINYGNSKITESTQIAKINIKDNTQPIVYSCSAYSNQLILETVNNTDSVIIGHYYTASSKGQASMASYKIIFDDVNKTYTLEFLSQVSEPAYTSAYSYTKTIFGLNREPYYLIPNGNNLNTYTFNEFNPISIYDKNTSMWYSQGTLDTTIFKNFFHNVDLVRAKIHNIIPITQNIVRLYCQIGSTTSNYGFFYIDLLVSPNTNWATIPVYYYTLQ